MYPELPHSSNLLAIEYEANMTSLIDYVNNRMLARDDIDDLVGVNNIDVMKSNHINHARLIITTLKLNRTDILDVTLPWVYRVYHNMGFSYNYFPVVLEYWSEAIRTFLHAEQARGIIKLYQWIIRQHKKSIDRASEYLPVEYHIEPKWQNCYDDFLTSLYDGNAFNCSEIAERCCPSKDIVVPFYVNVLQPALYNIGNLWEDGIIGVAEEHLATAIVSRIISQFSFRFKTPISKAHRAAVISITGEHHQVGAQMVASSLEFEGWDVLFLGDSMPLWDILKYVMTISPQIIAISVTMVYNLDSVISLIHRIKESSTFSGIKILVGGLAFDALPKLAQEIGADGYAANCIDAREWCIKVVTD